MLLDEAIEHLDYLVSEKLCGECKAEHEQLKAWLMELKSINEYIEFYNWPPRHKDETYGSYIYRCFFPLPQYVGGEPVELDTDGISASSVRRCYIPFSHCLEYTLFNAEGEAIATVASGETVSRQAQPPDTQDRIDKDAKLSTKDYWRCGEYLCTSTCPAKIAGETPRERYGVPHCGKAQTLDLLRRQRELDINREAE